MLVFGKAKIMNIDAAEQFWNWFQEHEMEIIDGINNHNYDFIWEVDEMLTPVFPYFKKELEFQIGYNDGVGEFFFFHFGNKALKRDAEKLAELMPEKISGRWNIILEK